MKYNICNYILTFFKNIKFFLIFKDFFLAKQLTEVSTSKKDSCIDDFEQTVHLKQIIKKIVKLYKCYWPKKRINKRIN